MRLVDADELKQAVLAYKTMPEIRKAICEVIDNATTYEPDVGASTCVSEKGVTTSYAPECKLDERLTISTSSP